MQPPPKRPKKEQKDYALPDYKAKNLIIVIRVLQTDKKKKNILTLDRSVVETLSLKMEITWIEKLSEERSSAKAGHIFCALCEGIRRIYNNMDLDIEDIDSIEGTNGIWQVSVLCPSSCCIMVYKM